MANQTDPPPPNLCIHPCTHAPSHRRKPRVLCPFLFVEIEWTRNPWLAAMAPSIFFLFISVCQWFETNPIPYSSISDSLNYLVCQICCKFYKRSFILDNDFGLKCWTSPLNVRGLTNSAGTGHFRQDMGHVVHTQTYTAILVLCFVFRLVKKRLNG